MKTKSRAVLFVSGCILASLFAVGAQRPAANPMVEWAFPAGDAGGMHYSPLTTINASNVNGLKVAWTWKTEEEPKNGAVPGTFETSAVMLNDVLYLSTPYNRVVALDANTGEKIWDYDPHAYEAGQPPNGTGFVHRGLATWTDGRQRRIFINSRWRLIALDGETGKPVSGFGTNGEVDLTQDLLWPVNKLHYTNTSPPLVYKNLVILGNGVADRLVYKKDPPGDIQAFDVRTGKRVWKFNPIPQKGEFGNDTWEGGAETYTGHTNAWAPMTLDEQRGLLYIPFGTPSNDYYGGARKGNALFAETLVCLDANTGKRVWHFQAVHHGLWDYDLASPPTLGTVHMNGKAVDIVAAAGKTGFLYVFDRATGKPIWPIEERPVPQSDVPGEKSSATQPFPTKPAPFAKQGITEDDVIDFTPELKAAALEQLKKYRTGPLFTPPSLDGSIVVPGNIGGANFGGGAFDPDTGIIYIKATNAANLARIAKPQPGQSDADYWGSGSTNISVSGLPLLKPPYGTLTAIDLNTGDHVWQVPIGDTANVRNNPLLKGIPLPEKLGSVGAPGSIVTGGGLVFSTAGDSTLYAIDKRNGKLLWEGDLGQRSNATPITYQTRSGKQFVVIATGAASTSTLYAFSR
jgi:quinoprotein glucose dehydrogenase